MKRVLAVFLLAAVLCFSFVSCGNTELQIFSGNSDLTFKIENGEAILTHVPNKSNITVIDIPDEYDGAPVTKIADFAAVNLEYVTKVIIGKNIKEISDWAFGNSKKIAEFAVDEENPYISDVDGVVYTKDMKTLLFYPPSGGITLTKDNDGNEIKSITYVIPEGVETIRTKAFYKCYDLRDVTLPESLKRIEEKAFFRCNLQTITLPDGLEFIGKDAFAFCEQAKTVTIPASVKQIDEYAFYSCFSLSEVTVLAKESDMTLGKKWYPTKNGGPLDTELVINWENQN